MFEIGSLCIKLAGRDAGKKCVIIEILEKNNVMIDGETRRRKVNINHIEPLNQKIDIKANAPHSEVKSAFKKIGIEIKDSKSKPAVPRPKKIRKANSKTRQAAGTKSEEGAKLHKSPSNVKPNIKDSTPEKSDK